MLTGSNQGKWVTCHTARGVPYTVWEPRVRIRDTYLNCTIYLYRSKYEADEGTGAGGSGFVVSVPAERLPPPAGFVYAVTNKHVIENGACCIRYNTKIGGHDTATFKASQWHLAKDDDLAVLELPASIKDAASLMTVAIEHFLTEKLAQHYDVGPGDEAVLVGRFVNQEGKQRNTPTARFGYIAQKASEPIEYEGQIQDSWLCEVKSIGGFSGSPVFFAPLDWKRREGQKPKTPFAAYLLGVDWAHIQNIECAFDRKGDEIKDIRYSTNTGMMALVPAWKLEALLNKKELVDNRRAAEAEEIERRKAPAVRLDSSGPAVVDLQPTDANPQHREDFSGLLKAAAKKK